MRDQNKAPDQQSGAARRAMTRRSAVALAAMATFGLAIGIGVLPASAQGRMEIDDRSRGRDFDRDGDRLRDQDRFRDRDGERRFEGRREGKWEIKDEPKGEAKWDGKDDIKDDGKQRGKPAKSGHIKLTVGGDGATSVDVKCADGEPMRACADVAKEIIDKIRPPK
jgi:hypothetical protein